MSKTEHRHLLKTWYFWIFLVVPVITGSALMVAITLADPNMTACFTSQCVQTFFYTFKFPIAIIGSSLPLTAMIASVHRSLEASHQINLVSAQYAENVKNNRFGNYLKHREGFDKVIQTVCTHDSRGKNIETHVDSATLYGEVFPDSGYRSADWNGEWSEEWLKTTDSAANAIVSQMKKATTEEFNTTIFLQATIILGRQLRITHEPFISIGLKDEKLQAMLPDHDDIGLSIMSGIAQSFGVLIIIRSYLGHNNSNHLMMAEWYLPTLSKLNNQTDKLRITKYDHTVNSGA